MINIRKPNIKDIDALEELFQLTHQHTFILRPVEEFKIGDYVKSTHEDEVWVAEEAGVIIGFVSVYISDNFICLPRAPRQRYWKAIITSCRTKSWETYDIKSCNG